MTTKKIDIVANLILPSAVILVTATLFVMFRPDAPAALFYLNLGYAIFLEAILFGYINRLYRKIKEFSTPFLAVFGIYALYYAITGAGWMLVYSLVLSRVFSLKIYIAALIVLTLLWIIISVLTARVDSHYKSTVDALSDRQRALDHYTRKITLLASRHEKLRAEKGTRYATESSNATSLDRLKWKISFLALNVLNDETARARLDAMLDRCEEIIEETELATGDNLAPLEKKMHRFVNNSVDEIDLLKSLTRG
ncbi:MAG: hypothetical protein LBK12_08910 [Odoribacteraceae bacterium]|jgi:hypothetical protein|nr:hypothetical protein [Odoribacteraceae bacterium]